MQRSWQKLLIASTRELRKAIKTAKAAPKEIKYFYNEASVFTLLIDTFHGLAKDSPEPEGNKALRKRKRLLDGIEQQCTDVKEGVEDLVIKFNRTYRGSSDTRAMTVWARVLWVIRKPDLEELRLLMNDTKMSLTTLSVMLKWEDAKRGNDKGKIRLLEGQLEEARAASRQARKDLQEHMERPLHSLNNRLQERLDEHLASTKGIEKFVLRALEREERERERAKREKRVSPRARTTSSANEHGGRRPPPPPDDPNEFGTGPSVSKPPSPGPPRGHLRESATDSDPRSARVPPATADVPQDELVEDVQPRSLSRTFYEVLRGSLTPPLTASLGSLPSPPPTAPSGIDTTPDELVEDAQPQKPPAPSLEVRQPSPVPPSIAVQLADDLLRDQRVEEARPPAPSSRISLAVKQHESPAPSPPILSPAPPRRRRPRRTAISEESGFRPADAKNYTTNKMQQVSPPGTQSKEEEQQQQQAQGRSMRLARDQRLLESQTRGKKGKWQAHVEDAPPSPPQEETTRREPALEQNRSRSPRSLKEWKGGVLVITPQERDDWSG
ncbi:hypothetical protein PG984_000425 [Apiospora sp. TS-2023a]